MALLEIQNLTLEFRTEHGSAQAVDDLSLETNAGEIVCLVGESGSGKSVTALSIARLLPSPPAIYAGGRILLEGQDVLQMNDASLREVRGGVVSYVFQEPGASLHPVQRVGNQILEAMQVHQPNRASKAEAIRWLQAVGIPAPELRFHDYPFQMSGGMKQRVGLAIALASQPKLLVADEPTTALDTTIQAQMLDLLRDLRRQFGMAILLISHNMGIVSELADRVGVMYAGQIVETASTRTLLRNPLHPYTRALLQAVPKLEADGERLQAIPGMVPHIGDYPPGCRFFPRCPTRKPECETNPPKLVEAAPGHWVRCAYWKELVG